MFGLRQTKVGDSRECFGVEEGRGGKWKKKKIPYKYVVSYFCSKFCVQIT